MSRPPDVTGPETGPAASVLLRATQLGKRYTQDGPPALSNVSFDVHEGELLSIVGRSGCGKTTLLRLLCALTPPSEGAVLLEGRPVVAPPPEVGVVFQDYSRSLFPWLSVLANVMFPLPRRAGLSRAARVARATTVLEELGLEGAAHRYPWQLSGGMQQRVAIARALVSHPKILLLDEPFASVDALTRADLQDLVLRVHRDFEGRPVTIVHVTHDIDEAVYLGDRVLILGSAPGRVVGTIDVDLPRPREQIATRSSPRFLALRNQILEVIRPREGYTG